VILAGDQAVTRGQQLIGRLYLVGLVIGIYVFVVPVWIAANLYQLCSRMLSAGR